MIKRPADLSWWLHLRGLLRSLGRYAAQAACALAFLPDEAYYSLDAVLRTLTRLIITKRNLLQWRTSTDAEQGWRNDLVVAIRAMWFAPVLSLAVGSYLVRFRADALPASVPLLFLWLISPAIAWWLSRPLPSSANSLECRMRRTFLEELSRKTWRFFETFVGPEDNWLPPDNYQEYPVAVIAHRTSPTNVGLALLSNSGRLRLWVYLGRSVGRADGQNFCQYGTSLSGFAGTFSIGTIPARSSHFRRAMFRPLIVATLSAIC